VGYVLRFNVRNEFLQKYKSQQVGDMNHREFWIPAEDLAEFNANIVGEIEIVAQFLPG
jgi:hypothetical protein